jgi:predicted nucleic acid-binding protein
VLEQRTRLDSPVDAAAAGIFRETRGRGLTLSTVDSLLAALAIEYNAALFTLDPAHDAVRVAVHLVLTINCCGDCGTSFISF